MSYKQLNDDGPIRVLQVIGTMDRGGAETMIMNLYRNIDRTKIQFDFLLSSRKKGHYENEIKSLGGRVFHITHFNGLNPLSYYKECSSFFTKHPELRIVHGHIGSSAALYLKAAKQVGCFTIAHSHNGKPTFSLHYLVYSIYSYPTRYIADQLFGCSTEAGIARYGKKAVEGKHYKNFNNGIDLNQFYFQESVRNIIRESFSISSDTIVIGTVGRIVQQKNPDKILNIFTRLVDKHPNCLCLWIGAGSEEERIKKEIEKRGLTEKIQLLGVRTDVSQLLNAFDCFVFPSLWEGLPVTIIEAQASGLPIVLSDVISKEVEISPLLTWLKTSDSDEEWATQCYNNAINLIGHRRIYVDLIKRSGYDISETSKTLCDFYLKNAKHR